MPREYAFQKGELVEASVVSSLANDIVVNVLVEYNNGKRDRIVFNFTTAATRTLEQFSSRHLFLDDGKVLNAVVRPSTASKRGETYLGLYITPTQQSSLNYVNLCQGYVYSQHNLSLGEFIEAGPGGGEGILSLVNMATDVTGDTDTLIGLGTTNALRKVIGFTLKYNAAATAFTRVIVVTIRGPYGSEPTGYGTTTTRNIWTSPSLTLTTGEEGLIHVNSLDGKEYVVVNDNGTLAVASTATAPSPFPFWVREADGTAAFVVTITTGQATDVYNADVLVEEWLVL